MVVSDLGAAFGVNRSAAVVAAIGTPVQVAVAASAGHTCRFAAKSGFSSMMRAVLVLAALGALPAGAAESAPAHLAGLGAITFPTSATKLQPTC